MTPLTITHATGTTVLDAYALDPETLRYAFRSEPHPNEFTPTIKWGDRLPLPAPFGVRAWVGGATLTQAASNAYAIASACRSATLVSTFEGARGVSGLMRYRVVPDEGPMVVLHLEFAPLTSEAS